MFVFTCLAHKHTHDLSRLSIAFSNQNIFLLLNAFPNWWIDTKRASTADCGGGRNRGKVAMLYWSGRAASHSHLINSDKYCCIQSFISLFSDLLLFYSHSPFYSLASFSRWSIRLPHTHAHTHIYNHHHRQITEISQPKYISIYLFVICFRLYLFSAILAIYIHSFIRFSMQNQNKQATERRKTSKNVNRKKRKSLKDVVILLLKLILSV